MYSGGETEEVWVWGGVSDDEGWCKVFLWRKDGGFERGESWFGDEEELRCASELEVSEE